MNSDVLMIADSVMIPVACKMMQKRVKDEIIVTNDDGKPVGIVTDQDILKKIGEAFANPQNTRLDDIMSFPIIGISQDASLHDALNLMNEKKVRKLAVYSNEGKIVGMMYQHTIVNLIRQNTSSGKQDFSIKSILWNLGTVLQFAGVLMFLPAIVATLLNDTVVATGIYLMATLLLICGFFMNSYGEKHPLSLRGTAILVFSSFMALVLFGMIPHLFATPYGTDDPVVLFADGFFSSSAGFTTGGLSIIDNPEDLSRSFAFYRSYTQFVGGLSFIYLIMTAFYPENKLNSFRGLISGQTPKIRELFVTITIIFSIYVVIIAGLLFYLGERNLLDDFAVAMSAVSTGGWVPDSNIMHNLSTPEYAVIIAGMILGALPFSFHYAFIRTKFLSVKISKEVSMFFVILAIASIVFMLSMNVAPIDAVFNLISGSTTTGFQNISLQMLNPVAYAVMIIVMIIGGCGFSTAGGLKVFRLFGLVNMRSISKTSWKKMRMTDKNEFYNTLIILSVLPIVPIFVGLHMMEYGFSFNDGFFDAVSAITTTGLGTGTISDSLSPFTKMVFGFLMILGRIEIVLLVYMFVPKLMR